MARPISNFNAASEVLLTKPKIFDLKWHRTLTIHRFMAKKTEESEEQQHEASKPVGISIQTNRRAVIGLGILTLSTHLSCQNTRAEDNGLWLTGPIPVPSVVNKIANEETGTRSFLKKGIYMANIGAKGSAYRLRQYAFDLMGLGDLLGQDAWNYIRKYLRLKSTVMYYDFDKVISAAPIDEKQPLTDLANKLFDSVEKLEDAVKMRNDPEIKSCYEDTTVLLQEVMTWMA
ncbi:photosynthetic NDH subunit of lumenal location 3, chloroplastic [Magnolia sinica]|uniref:photosynthetic NDH subunit of lumenal location 3, chloroplastic n=1 Tax=Magnolia sinica TaxID=86752 RepID=UPI00265953ED|nr:photosynthetic NDH subunit of lumenal location 3, chloroplastic [Magnolia sinica]